MLEMCIAKKEDGRQNNKRHVSKKRQKNLKTIRISMDFDIPDFYELQKIRIFIFFFPKCFTFSILSKNGKKEPDFAQKIFAN